MLLSEPLASLIISFRSSFFFFFSTVNESSELDFKKIRVQHIPLKVSHVLEFLPRNTYVQYFDLWHHEILSHTCVRQENS